MMDTQSIAPARSTHRGDALLAGIAWSVTSTGIVLGGRPGWIALAALALPLIAYLAFGFLAGRGGVVACVVAAIGVAILDGAATAQTALSVIVLGMLVSTALLGGRSAGRLLSPEPTLRAITIEVEYRGMPGTNRPKRRLTSATVRAPRPDRMSAHCV
jgi:hypothetical protein